MFPTASGRSRGLRRRIGTFYLLAQKLVFHKLRSRQIDHHTTICKVGDPKTFRACVSWACTSRTCTSWACISWHVSYGLASDGHASHRRARHGHVSHGRVPYRPHLMGSRAHIRRVLYGRVYSRTPTAPLFITWEI